MTTSRQTENTTTTAVVTGGSRGLGRATALALADAGVDVVITFRSGEQEATAVVEEIEARGGRGTAMHLDVTAPSTFADFREQLSAHLPDGHFDILVNNAGTALYSALRDTTPDEFDDVFAVHVRGPFFLTQALEPLLRDGGRVINVSSALTRMAFARSGPYAAAKGAVEVLTRYQALEYGARGITANVIAVGPVPTDFGGGHLRSDPALQDAMVESAALGRLATPEDIGAAIAGLTTASGSWITGQRIEASGGVRL
ncbi:SDR family NAD(P)-dependent oxidoreductase [Williamsia deligens]|uniref:SDR family NAD(P)-dependent oxidoreductase n=1 Tax=Williamsia deligens TaxID=321325 RepID=A0ABW3GD43_9NOCA|nr:SDR family oxidoreductase [Williamsia deligens]MCP2192415.1 NAD(P)-dependent dehydrogenase, short-chain alcohol dehydrogenase family [Williamsia deligens]